jgi:hypothetical protein
MALHFLKASGKFDPVVREWEQKPAAQKTWANIKTFISLEYAKENKQNKLTAKKFRANNIDKQAKATEELIAALTKNHTRQMKTLIKSTTDTMREMMSLIKNNQQVPNNQQAPNNQSNNEKRRRGKKSARNTTRYLFANIAERNIPPNQKKSVGN